jgi:hypothetical protein
MNLLLFLFLVGCAAAAQAQEPQLTARDAFWSAKDLVNVSPNPVSQSAPLAIPSSEKRPAPPPQTKLPPKESSTRPAQIDPETVPQSGFGAKPHLAHIAATAPQPLGLRYTVLKQNADGGYSEIFPDTIFHSGDKIKLSVMANQPGYLYLVVRGSSGSWDALFPEADDAAGSNRVEAGRVYQIPSSQDRSFQFNDQPGEERIFLLLSRTPVSDLDSVIFDLQQHTTPSSDAPQQLADGGISDQLIQKIQTRDLTLVKEVKESTQSAEGGGGTSYGEKAVYVVNEGGPAGPPSRVFADFTLQHR